MRRLARTNARTHATHTYTQIHIETHHGPRSPRYPPPPPPAVRTHRVSRPETRARPRTSVTLFSDFPFMGYRLVSICRFVTTPGDLHGQIGLLHAATFPLPPSPLPPIYILAFYITIFRHRAREISPGYLAPAIIFFFLPFFPRSSPFFPFVRAPVFPGR